jgi:hypothetical protein
VYLLSREETIPIEGTIDQERVLRRNNAVSQKESNMTVGTAIDDKQDETVSHPNAATIASASTPKQEKENTKTIVETSILSKQENLDMKTIAKTSKAREKEGMNTVAEIITRKSAVTDNTTNATAVSVTPFSEKEEAKAKPSMEEMEEWLDELLQ